MRRQPLKKPHAKGIGKKFVKTPRTYVVSVAGVSYHNDDGSSRQTIISRCKPGETLMLIREPDNRFQGNAPERTADRLRSGARIARNEDSGKLAHETATLA